MSLYRSVVPVARQALVNLRDLTVKGADHLKDQGEAALLEARLAPDMFSFAQQIRSACKIVDWGMARLAGTPDPHIADDEQGLTALLARIDRVIAMLDGMSREIIDGRSGQEVVTRISSTKLVHFPDGADYAGRFILPNLFFHSAMAYAILRHRGAPLGKLDYLGDLDIRAAV